MNFKIVFTLQTKQIIESVKMSEGLEKKVTMQLSEYESMQSYIEKISEENELLKQGKRVLITSALSIKSGVIVLDRDRYSLGDFRYSNYDHFNKSTIKDCDFDLISKDSHNEIVREYKKAIHDHNEDIVSKCRKINKVNIDRANKLNTINFLLKVLCSSLALALAFLLFFVFVLK